MPLSAKDVRARVRAQLEEQLKEREAAALKVVTAWEQVEVAKQALAAAEATAGQAAKHGLDSIGGKDLASLTGIDERNLRRAAKAAEAVVDVTDAKPAAVPAAAG